MTKDEFRDYMKNYYDNRTGTEIFIESMKEYTTVQIVKKGYPEYWLKRTREYYAPIIKHYQKQIDRMDDQIRDWSGLIKNDTYRQMFLDHYQNGLTFETIADKYIYSFRRVISINKSVIDQIHDHLITDLIVFDDGLQAFGTC